MLLGRCALVGLMIAASFTSASGSETEEPVNKYVLQHLMDARLDVPVHSIAVKDTVRIFYPEQIKSFNDSSAKELRFLLHRDLKIRAAHVNGKKVDVKPAEGWDPRHFWDRPPYAELEGFDIAREYALPLKAVNENPIRVVLEYSGVIADSLHAPDVAYGRSFETTSGRIVDQGAYLAGSTFWVPWFGEHLLLFDLTVDLPQEWKAIAQGDLFKIPAGKDKSRNVMRWGCSSPMEEIYLIAGPYQMREDSHPLGKNRISVYTFCYENTGADITDRYIEGTKRYLDQYSARFGAYPFGKFALVENYWQSGYGMPSFTLLGDKVIRLPFILDTSFGHEILHNWWGNGVFVKEEEGNWCEGLTTYCADYAAKENESAAAAAEYRRGALLGYRDFAAQGGRDFALVKFRERDSAATQAVGYGKTMMVFHMLDEMLGREKFDAALRDFYERKMFSEASWNDLRASFERQAKTNLVPWFEQWVEREGAPVLALENVQVHSGNSGLEVLGTITQSSPEFDLDVPVRVIASGDTSWTRVELRGARTDFVIPVMGKPKELAVDPEFDLFRILHEGEIAPALSGVLGAERTRFVLGAQCSPAMQEAFKQAIAEWGADSTACIMVEGETKCENWNGATWILGPGPLATKAFEKYSGEPVGCRGKGTDVFAGRGGEALPAGAYAVFLPENDEVVTAIARKIPHYSKYSYLKFAGTTNVGKGMWPAGESPLCAHLVFDAKPQKLPKPRKASK
ncbi:MAG TPA: M1 family aminopeptidase [bacterium]|nr:M1 family aminopeptidase [bacterium]